MSSEIAIALTGVSKTYEIYSKPLHRLVQLFSKNRKLYEEFTALRNVDLTLYKGETVGIVGRNGSGKSTLLQIIAGTLHASTGSIVCNGRISAILELGAGFNPEFTGLENARLNALIMGIDEQVIESRIPSIAEFSELGDFIRKPVKTYSSGMYVRLAFSVIINMQPDILIIDEALAVGDAAFQRKCFRKLEELRSGGATILFVSHATDSVIAHSDRAVFMDQGEIKQIGEPKTVVNSYLERLFDKPRHDTSRARNAGNGQPAETQNPPVLNTDPDQDGCVLRPQYSGTEYRWGNQKARFIDFLVLDEAGQRIGSVCRAGTTLLIKAAVYFGEPQRHIIYGLTVKTVDGITVFGSNSQKIGVQTRETERGEVIGVDFRLRLDLVAGEYFISLGLVSMEPGHAAEVFDRRYDILQLIVEDDMSAFGYAALPFTIQESELAPKQLLQSEFQAS